MNRFGWALVSAMLFAGCSLTREAPPVQNYRLGTDEVQSQRSAYCSDRVLRIALIQAPDSLQGTTIFYAGEENRMYHYTRARWEQPPLDALQQISEKSVIDSGLFKAVVPYKSLAKNDWLLELRVEKMMQQINNDGSGETQLILYGVLIDQYSRTVVDKKRFEDTESAANANVQSGVDALSKSVKAFQHDLAGWLKQACDAYPRPDRSNVDLR